MKTRILNIIKVLTCVAFIIIPIKIYAVDNVYYEGQQKGDLSCPNGVSNSNCQMYDASGNELSTASSMVNRVSVKAENNGIIVNKIVSKTETIGRYEVKFNVSGLQQNITTTNTPAYIVIIRDASNSMTTSSFEASKNAIQKFADDLHGENRYFALIQFGTKLTNNTSTVFTTGDDTSTFFSTVRFCVRKDTNNSCKQEDDSNIYKAFQRALSLLQSASIPDNAQKFIVVLGDGEYWYSGDTDKFWNYTKSNYVDPLKRLASIYSIHYNGSQSSHHASYMGPRSNGFCPSTSLILDCDTKNMKQIASNDSKYKHVTSDADFETFLTAIKNDIEGEIASETPYSAYIRDNMGEEFTSNNLNYRILSVNNVTLQGVETAPFYIEINPAASKGWHETNDGFSLLNNDISSNINPEVYWEPEKNELESCSSGTNIKMSNTTTGDYFTEICKQGDSNIDGFRANVVVNNLIEDTRKFNISYGSGFPISISLSNNVECSYELKKDENNNYIFSKDYASALQMINSTDARVQADGQALKIYLDSVLDNYTTLTNNQTDLVRYARRFNCLTPKVTIKYKKTGNVQEVLFKQIINESNPDLCPDSTSIDISNVNCTNIVKETINSMEVIVSQVCSLNNISKEMTLQNSCLNMKTGEQVDCQVNSNTMLSGGNNIYPILKETGGYVTVEINNADFFGRDIKLEGDKVDNINGVDVNRCEFDVSPKKKIIYRQISVADPFIQGEQFNSIKKREIGRNYSNSKFNFVNIIKSDIWDTTPQYVYKLSKLNVDNIRKDTIDANSRVSSYLGTNCYITNANNYECDFTRNRTDDGESESNFFSDVTINE